MLCCSRSLVRWGQAVLSAAVLLGAMQAGIAWGGDGPVAGPPPAAEDIREQVTLQNSDFFAPPPSPTQPAKAERFLPRNFKIQAKMPSRIRVRLPGNQALLTPAVARGKVFVGGGFDSHEFYCLAADTGRPIWGTRLPDNGPSAPAYEDGTLIFSTESCTLYVLDASSGNCLWATWLGSTLITAPCIAGNRVLVCYPAAASGEKAVPTNFVFAARDLRTGKPLWQRWIDETVISAPVVGGDDVYLTTFAGTLYGFRLSDGEVDLARRCRATSAPLVCDDAVYVSRRVDDTDGKMPLECVAGLDRRTGEPIFASPARNAIYLAEPALRSRLSRQLRAETRRAAAGSAPSQAGRSPFRLVAWKKKKIVSRDPNDPDYEPGGGPPEVADTRPESIKLVGRSGPLELQRFDGSRLTALGGNLFNCMGDDLLSVDPRTGKMRWSLPLERAEADDRSETVALPPAAAAGRLFIATRAGQLLKVRPRDGNIDGRLELDARPSTQPVIDEGRIVIGTVSGELIVLNGSDPTLTGWNQWGGNAVHSNVGVQVTAPGDLTPPAARVALVEMVESGRDAELKLALKGLALDDIETRNDGSIAIGKWRVDLDGRTFVGTLATSPRVREYEGVFYQNARSHGRWTARITARRQARKNDGTSVLKL